MKIRNSETLCGFKRSIWKFISLSSNFVSNYYSTNGTKLITRLRLGLSHFYEHKFRHNFQENLNPIRSYGEDNATSIHYLLHCSNCLEERRTLLDNLQSAGENIHVKNDSRISKLLLFGISSRNDALNTCILNATIQYILATKRFESPF